MEHLLSTWPEVVQRFRMAKQILLLSDYDGTLTPIVAQPELANIPEKTRQTLQALAIENRITLGFVSGRALSDLKQKINIHSAIYAGNHGFEIEGPGLSFVNPLAEEIRPLLRVIARILTLALEPTKGAIVENKGLTVSVHYRQVDTEKEKDLKHIFLKVIHGVQGIGKFKVTSGKKVYELRPAVNWDKGKAIQLLMEKYARKNGKSHDILPIYMGDDTTDEDGFDVIGQFRNGIAVYIGDNSHRTAANYYLKSPYEVNDFLELLLECSRRGFK